MFRRSGHRVRARAEGDQFRRTRRIDLIRARRAANIHKAPARIEVGGLHIADEETRIENEVARIGDPDLDLVHPGLNWRNHRDNTRESVIFRIECPGKGVGRIIDAVIGKEVARRVDALAHDGQRLTGIIVEERKILPVYKNSGNVDKAAVNEFREFIRPEEQIEGHRRSAPQIGRVKGKGNDRRVIGFPRPGKRITCGPVQIRIARLSQRNGKTRLRVARTGTTARGQKDATVKGHHRGHAIDDAIFIGIHQPVDREPLRQERDTLDPPCEHHIVENQIGVRNEHVLNLVKP